MSKAGISPATARFHRVVNYSSSSFYKTKTPPAPSPKMTKGFNYEIVALHFDKLSVTRTKTTRAEPTAMLFTIRLYDEYDFSMINYFSFLNY